MNKHIEIHLTSELLSTALGCTCRGKFFTDYKDLQLNNSVLAHAARKSRTKRMDGQKIKCTSNE